MVQERIAAGSPAQQPASLEKGKKENAGGKCD
jgi:hypothetical protein